MSKFNQRLKTIHTHYTKYGFRETLRFIFKKIKIRYRIHKGLEYSDIENQQQSAKEILDKYWLLQRQIQTYHLPDNKDTKYRVNLLTDSVSPGSLFGGVATSIILSALVCKRLQCNMRLITRLEPIGNATISNILKANNIEKTFKIHTVFADIHDKNCSLDICNNDIFITTSWWTTVAALKFIHPEKIIYLLQEDERMFYPLDDHHLACSELLANEKIRFVVNTKLLYDHLVDSGYSNIAVKGYHFEPAFNNNVFYKSEAPSARQKNIFVFYARPNHPRNLFIRGLEVINTAIQQGLLQAETWDIHFVGKDIPNLNLAMGWQPTKHENLSFTEYAQLMRKVDLALSLMYTPHPSYPPLDIAACGGVVVTNKFGFKQNLSQYSKNIICSGLKQEDLLAAIAEGIELSQNKEKRQQNFEENQLANDWHSAFKPVLDCLFTREK